MYEVRNTSPYKLDALMELLHKFIPYAQKFLKYDKPVEIELMSDSENAKNPLGKTAFYDAANFKIGIYTDDRHTKDILRSLSHELVHHGQNCRGEFDKPHNTEEGYIKKDPHLQNMEGEAYLLGNGFIIRFFEEHMKEDGFMAEGRNRMKVRILSERRTPATGGAGHASHGRGNKEEEVTLEEIESLIAEMELDEEQSAGAHAEESGDETDNRPSLAKDMDLDTEDEDLEEVRTSADGRVSSKGGSHGRGISEPDLKFESVEGYRLARKKIIADRLIERWIKN
jgi:hypothetical protein